VSHDGLQGNERRPVKPSRGGRAYGWLIQRHASRLQNFAAKHGLELDAAFLLALELAFEMDNWSGALPDDIEEFVTAASKPPGDDPYSSEQWGAISRVAKAANCDFSIGLRAIAVS
jgi:hypothetical protein